MNPSIDELWGLCLRTVSDNSASPGLASGQDCIGSLSERTGEMLIAAMRVAPGNVVEFERTHDRMPVRDIGL